MLGLGLDADAVGPLHVAAEDRPHHTDEEHEPGTVPDGGVALVDVPVEELGRLGELVVDLEDGRDREQDQEGEVDEAVHDPGGGITQQRLHVHAGAEVLEAAAGVLGRGPATVRRTTLPVAHPLAEQHRPVEDEHREDRVEDELPHARDVAEHLTLDVGIVVPLSEGGGDPRAEDDRGEQRADSDRQLVGLQLHAANVVVRGRTPRTVSRRPGRRAPAPWWPAISSACGRSTGCHPRSRRTPALRSRAR